MPPSSSPDGSWTDFVQTAYQTVLRRPADPDGLSAYVSALSEGRLSAVDWLLQLAGSPEARGLHSDASAATTGAWRRFLPSRGQFTEFGLAQQGPHNYAVAAEIAVEPRQVFSMMAMPELVALYGLARDAWTGQGDILDMGPYFGLTTFALASGMAANIAVPEAHKRKRLQVYDLFMSYEHPGVSIFPEFAEINRRWLPYLDVHPGDAGQIGWRGTPIEILFLDLAKTVELQDHVAQHFLQHLIVGGVLIQQDYVYFDQWWIHVLMELFHEHFEFMEVIFGASGLFRLVRPLPDLRSWTLSGATSVEERIALHRRHVEKAPPHIQGVLWSAHAKLLVDHGAKAEARLALNRVEVVGHDDPLQDFSTIVNSNRQAVLSLLDGAR